MATEFDLAQTFYVDKDAVRQAETIFITSVELYFESKPVAGKTKTGIYKPGASIHVCPIDAQYPVLEQVFPEVARVEYDDIIASTSALTPTKFTFNYPMPISTGISYALLVKIDGSDDDFKLWWNKAGEKLLDTTNTTQVSSGKVDGSFYTITNGKALTALKDADLKFRVNIARFTSSSTTYKMYNSENEFFKYYANSIQGNFKGGEYVWQNNAPSTGTINGNTTSTTLIGTSTSFSNTVQVGDKFIVTDGTLGNADVRTVVSIANNTLMVIDRPLTFANTSTKYVKTPIATVFAFNGMTERLTLEDSTANSTVYFTVDSYINGVDSLAQCRIETISDFAANYVRPAYNIFTPASTSANVSLSVANSSYNKATSPQLPATINEVKFIDSYPAVFASRSHEVLNGATLFDNSKSFESSITFNTSNIYTSPLAKQENMDIYVTRYEINNSSDLEYTSSGNATSKYVSKRVVLADGQDAEDMRVYISAYKPANTDILVYAKLQNNADPEPFDDKAWTQLQLISNTSILSNPYNRDDVLELQYQIPTYHPGTLVDGLYTTQTSNNVILGSGVTVNTAIVANDLVRIYSPTFPNNHMTSLVLSSNTSSLTIADPVSNASMVSTGLKIEKVVETNSGFVNIQHNNIVRYYNGTRSAFDGYKTFAIKIVLLSEQDYRVPHVNNLRAIAVSA